jgi:DNA primase
MSNQPTTEALDAVRNRIDIVELIRGYVLLKERGKNFSGLCPFHHSDIETFNVRRDRQFFHCFACQASGDAPAFLMRADGLTFEQAVRALEFRLEQAEFDESSAPPLRIDAGAYLVAQFCASKFAGKFFARAAEERTQEALEKDLMSALHSFASRARKYLKEAAE